MHSMRTLLWSLCFYVSTELLLQPSFVLYGRKFRQHLVGRETGQTEAGDRDGDGDGDGDIDGDGDGGGTGTLKNTEAGRCNTKYGTDKM